MEKLLMNVKLKQNAVESYIGKKLKLYKKGSQTTDFMIIALIVVIVGAALLGLLKTAMPELFQGILNKIKSTFEV